MSTTKLKKGEYIIHEGDLAQTIYFLLSGELDVIKQGKKINTIRANEVFGELAYVEKIPRTASVVATQDSIVVTFSPANLHRDLDELPEWVQNFIKGLIRKVVNLSEMVVENKKKAA